MYRKQISQKASPSLRSTPISTEIAPSPSYGSLSSVVQRAQKDPNSVSEDERQQLESAIGSRSTKEILAGKQTPWVPEFQGISAQLWGDAGQVGAPIQAKLTIGAAGDKYEQEADRVAEDVVQQINTPQTNALQKEDSAQIQANTLQHQQTDKEELQLKQLPEMVRSREVIAGGEASTNLASSINSAKAGGQPLEPGLQKQMGEAMGADFSGVRVHTDTQADQLNQAIQAKAFTTGQNVFFRQGAYEPESLEGQELLAHELTHVVQQNSSAVLTSKGNIGSMGNVGHAIIQRVGEVAAAQYTATTQIRRGNRRGSVDETEYRSLVLLAFIRNHQEEIAQAIYGKMEQQGLLAQEGAHGILQVIKDHNYFRAILADLFKVGNCGEFAALTYEHIVENTKGQFVYMARMTGNTRGGAPFDHAFTITSPMQVTTASQLNPQEALVVDAWNNYKVQTLQQFYNGDNPYGEGVNATNIIIFAREYARGRSLIDQLQLQYIAAAVEFVYASYSDIYEQWRAKLLEQLQTLPGIFSFRRDGRSVEDRSSDMDTSP